LSQWTALSARISLFLPLGEQTAQRASVLEVYQKLWSATPDSYQNAPAPNFPSHAQGQRDGLAVSCVIAQNRVDLIFSPKQTSQPSGSLNVIENTAHLCKELKALLSNLFIYSPSERYIGFSLFLHFAMTEKNTVPDANDAIASVIPKQYRPTLSAEENFLLQINSPYTSPVNAGLKINLIKKWSVEQFRIVHFAVQQAATAPFTPEVNTSIAPTVSFEVNNMPFDSSIHFSKDDQHMVLTDGLQRMASLQRDLGLNIDGFSDAL
jgi:hypothetical protein